MANTAGLPTYSAYRIAAMSAVYPATGVKAALYLASATRGPTDTAYSSTGEVTAGGGYTAGGATVSTSAPTQSGATTIWTPTANIQWTNLTTGGNVDCIQLYDTGASNRVIGTFTFGATSITAGTLTLQMPTNDASNALARWVWS